MMRRLLGLAGIALLAVGAVVAGVNLIELRNDFALDRARSAVESADWEEVLRQTESIATTRSLERRREMAELRCWALLAGGERDACRVLLEEVLELDAAGPPWSPDAVLAKLVLRSWIDSGRTRSAAVLARSAALAHRGDVKLLQVELATRSPVEGEAEVLAEVEARLGSDPSWLPQRVVLAEAHHRRGDHEAVVRVLGTEAPSVSDRMAMRWFEAHIRAHAEAGDLDGVIHGFELWRIAGAPEAELRARYALRLSVAQLRDPNASWVELLRGALEDWDEIEDGALRWGLYQRLITHLVGQDQSREALRVYDEAVLRGVIFPGLSRSQIDRIAQLGEVASNAESRLGTLRFDFPNEAANWTLLVSPGGDSSADADYVRHRVASGGSVSVERGAEYVPTRWVVRDEAERTRASGAAWPIPGREVAVEVEIVAEPTSPRRFEPVPRPADGRRRLFVMVLDCVDWHVVQHLRTRQELPALDRALSEGFRAVLQSRPALTAAAMESLVWPTRNGSASVLGWVHQMGTEIGGLASVGRNPVAFLSALLPEAESVFDVLGADDRVVANMLFSHGGIEAGRNAELTGPWGQRRAGPRVDAQRALTAEEWRHFAGLDPSSTARIDIESVAAAFDAAEAVSREGEVDVLLLRVEAIDLLTHALFGDLLEGGQDDGDAALYDVYRYVDARVASFQSTLDSDDHLVLMSDHGIRDPMQHAEEAVFVILGEDVPVGRAEGTPNLRGVPRVLADLLDVQAPWPDTGIADWASR